MYVIYLDESGDPNSWQNQNNFVIAGVAVHEGQIWQLTQQIEKIQGHYFPGISIPIKMHANEIRGGKGRFRDLSEADRGQLLDEMYKVVSEARFPNLVAFATAIDISAVHTPEQALLDTFEDVAERVNMFLVRQFRRGHPDKGLLIVDRSTYSENRYMTLISESRRSGTTHGYLGNIVDIPYFSQSGDTRMLQLADFCAYAAYRHYESRDDEYFNRILPRFDRRAPSHPPDGLKHIVAPGQSCDCVACSWR